jgi:hypothetical protein
LDDLIVGARNADPSGTVDAGKSYVVFGKSNPAVETEKPLQSPAFSPLIAKPCAKILRLLS